ncbi:MAG: hypothetical protein RLZZ479_716 [Bacteroidota bacterium]|jgi:hypothetical protein
MKHFTTFKNFLNQDSLDEGINYSSQKISQVAEDALDAFWESVANSFSDIKSGDFSPADTEKLRKAAEDAIKAWIKTNS